MRIFANQTSSDVAVVNADEAALRGRELGGQARRVEVCAAPGCDIGLDGGTIVAGDRPLLDVGELRLLGAHNVANAMAAAGAALAMGIEREAVAEGLRAFEGVPHRLEEVAHALYFWRFLIGVGARKPTLLGGSVAPEAVEVLAPHVA